jgi:hypothetical protein
MVKIGGREQKSVTGLSGINLNLLYSILLILCKANSKHISIQKAMVYYTLCLHIQSARKHFGTLYTRQ